MSLARKTINFKTPGLAQSIPIMALIMEVLWGYCWLAWVSTWSTWGWEQPPLNIWSCLILAIFTEVISRISLNREWSIKRVRLTVIPSTIVLLAILIRWNLGGGFGPFNTGWFSYAGTHISAVVVAAIFGFYLIWRGISGTRPKFYFSDLYRKFIIGMVAIIFLLLIWGASEERNAIWSNVGIYIVLFFGVGLLTLAMSNLESLRAELLQHKEDITAFSRRWISMLVVLVLAIIGIAVALASVFSTNIVGSVVHGLGVFANWLLIALSYILLPLGYVLEGIIFVGKWIISLLNPNAEPLKFNMPDLSDLEKVAEGQQPVGIPEALILALKWGALAIVIALVIYFLAKILIRYWEGKTEKEIEEVHETLWSWGVFKNDLKALFAWFFRWMKKRQLKRAEESMIPTPEVAINEDSTKIFSAREIYQAVLWQGRQLGNARRKHETPLEYQRVLNSRIEGATEEIDILTEAYIAERYGETPSKPEKLTLINRLWRSLRNKAMRKGEETA
jgi:hypothetical protein